MMLEIIEDEVADCVDQHLLAGNSARRVIHAIKKIREFAINNTFDGKLFLYFRQHVTGMREAGIFYISENTKEDLADPSPQILRFFSWGENCQKIARQHFRHLVLENHFHYYSV